MPSGPLTKAIAGIVFIGLCVLTLTVSSRATESDHLAPATIEIAHGTISIEFKPGAIDLPRDAILKWIRRSASAVTSYYGRFPVARYRIWIVPIADREGVLSGTTWGYGGARTRILLGSKTRQADLDTDWIMTHEMVHLAFPSVRGDHHWIEEGIATYVEPLARAAIGNYPATQVWDDLVRGLPKGMPATGDQGLDRTHTWGRTYWGGAMFCLMADLEIHKRTRGRYGLEDALRGVIAAGGNNEHEWPLERAFKVADDAIGAPVMTGLYADMKASPVAPDLGALWLRLGIEPRAESVVFNDRAPEASIRKAIMQLGRTSDLARIGAAD